MKSSLRSLLLTSALCAGSLAFAQPVPPYQVTVSGVVQGCTPNSSVNILTVQNTQPALDIDVPLDANCGFTIDLSMDSFIGWLQLSTPCNGAVQSTTLNYEVNALVPDSTYLFAILDCGGNPTDCEGVVGGSALPGSACDDGDPNTVGDTWTAACQCVGAGPAPCNACFTVEQDSTPANGPIPFTALFNNCSSGGVAPFTYAWSLDGGITFEAGVADTAFTFTEGVHTVCLMVTDNAGCTSTTCDSVLVDTDGNINGNVNTPCQAGFWVIQAYSIDSLNPNGSGPIPNELWIWNLSTGTGAIDYLWSFGDGTSSTDPFPTHFYANGGPYVLCLTMTDAVGCVSVSCDTISVDANGIYNGFIGHGNNDRSGFTINVLQQLPTSINETASVEMVELWPNPVVDAINMSLIGSRNSRLEMSIIDLNGKTVKSTSNAIGKGNNRVVLAVDELESGMYLLRISDGSTVVTRRFVKK